jgi:PAS domain S-box-containing protein
MLDKFTLETVFGHSNTPHLVLSTQAGFPAISVNQAFCDWSSTHKADVLHAQGSSSDRLGELLSLPATSLLKILEEVVAKKTAFKCKVAASGRVTKKMPIKEGFNLEVYPILEQDTVTALVIRVQPLATIQPLPAGEPGAEETSHVDYRLLPLILDSLANVIFVVDVEGIDTYRFSFANKAFQVTTGLPVSVVEGSLVDKIIPEPSLSLVKEKYAEAIRTGKQLSWQEVTEYPSGKKTGQVVAVPVFNAEGRCVRLIGMVHDVTEFKLAVEEQERLSQELALQNQDLQQFNYIVSHNLRAPVANVLGLSTLLTEKPRESQEFTEALGYLQESAQRMDDILRDLTQILSIRDRKDVTVNTEVPLQEVFDQALSDLRTPLEQSGAQITKDLGSETKVKANRAYLHSIFFNLLSNAIKYRSANRPLKISVTSEKAAQDCVKVTVSDNGSGFDLNKVRHQVFKLYKRFHPNNEGKGVGLFLVKTQVEAMGGKIKVDSEPDQGTTFKILLSGKK